MAAAEAATASSNPLKRESFSVCSPAMVRGSTAALALVVVTMVALGCESGGGSDSSFVVVATTTQVGDLTRNVAGRRAEVRQLLHPSSDPHAYEPRPSDARAAGRADLVLRSGGEVDGWLDGVLDSAGVSPSVVDLSEAVRTRGKDPHWWQDPRNAERAVTAIRDALSRADPAGRSTYELNSARYLRRLRKLDRAVTRCMHAVPARQRRLVTTHDALGYYAARYDIEVIGALIPSLSTQAQPSAGDTATLVDQIRAEGVKAVFPESSLNPKLERAVSRDAGASVGGMLWADTLGPEGSTGETYIGSIAANTAALVEGFTAGKRHCRPRA